MALTEVPYGNSSPTVEQDYKDQNNLIAARYLDLPGIRKVDYDNNEIPQGATVTIGGTVYKAVTAEPITGTPSDFVQIDKTALTALYVSSLTGVTWNSTYNEWQDVTGNLYLFSEAKAFIDGDVSETHTEIGLFRGLYVEETTYFNGYVGIGTNSPNKPLEIKGTNDDFSLRIVESENASDTKKGIEFWRDDGIINNAMVNIYAEREGSANKHAFVIETNNSGIMNENFRVTSSGHVGIGTATPDGTLHVHTASAGTVTPVPDADDLIVENSGAGGISILTPDSANSVIGFGSPSDNLGAIIKWNFDDKLFTMGSANTTGEVIIAYSNINEGIRITDTGVVGFKEPAPDADPGGLTVNHGANDGWAFTAKNTDINHTFTSIAQADTYFGIRKHNNDNGGPELRGFNDLAGRAGFVIHGYTRTAGAAVGAVVLRGSESNGGTSNQAIGDSDWLIEFSNNTNEVAHITGDGSFYSDNTIVATNGITTAHHESASGVVLGTIYTNFSPHFPNIGDERNASGVIAQSTPGNEVIVSKISRINATTLRFHGYDLSSSSVTTIDAVSGDVISGNRDIDVTI